MNKLLLLTLLFLTGCATIRQPTVQLSAEVGHRITEMERLHMLSIQRYFESERQKIDAFLISTWQPLFLKNFLATSNVLEELNRASLFSNARQQQLISAMQEYLTDPEEAGVAVDALLVRLTDARQDEPAIVKEVLNEYVEDKELDMAARRITALLGSDEPAKIMIEFAEAAHEQMALQREEMMAPIDQMETEALAALSASYAAMATAQSHVTGRLEAAAKLTTEQEILLGSLGLQATSNKITSGLSSLSAEINTGLSLLRGETEATTMEGKILEFIGKVSEIGKTAFPTESVISKE